MNSPQSKSAAEVAASTTPLLVNESNTVYTPTKFLAIFPSRQDATALGSPTGETDGKGKVIYRYTTRQSGITEADVAAHLAGQVSIVAIAIQQDNTCQWASLDVDDYLLDGEKVWRRCQALRLPLHLFRSKSGGLHLMAFFKEPRAAAAVRRLLASWAELIGVGKVELFPKQDVVGPEGTGNGMNLPFFGDAAGLASFGPTYCEIPVQEWPKDWPKGWQSSATGEAKGIRLRDGWEPEVELEKAGLTFTKRDHDNGYSLDYYADQGECLLWGGAHGGAGIPDSDSSAYSSVNRLCRFFVQEKDGARYICHQCFDSDCREKQNKTETALAKLGISVDDITVRPIVGQIGNPEVGRQAIKYAETDSGNAQRLIAEYGAGFRYLTDENKWIVFDGQRWKRDNNAIFAESRNLTLDLFNAAMELSKIAHATTGEEDRKKAKRKADEAFRFASRSDSAAGRLNMVSMARYEPGIGVRMEDFDRDPLLLNVQNGTLDLGAHTFREHRRADMISRICPVTYDPAATCPRWLKFLEQTFADRPEVIPFLQRSIGYSLTGLTSEQCFWLLIGMGRNGKSVLLNVIEFLLGDYAAATSFDTFMAKRKDAAVSPRDGLASLYGARFVRASEGEEVRKFAEATIKNLTGGEQIRTAEMYKKDFSYRPTFKIFLSTNHEPTITGTDDGIWRRIKRINFENQVPTEKVIRDLDKILEAEGSAILNWTLAGLKDYQQNGLQEPVTVASATQQYRAQQNPVRDFLEDRTLADPGAEIAARELLEKFNQWAHGRRRGSMTDITLGRAMRTAGFEPVRRGKENIRTYVGLKWRDQGVGGLVVPAVSPGW